MCHPLLGDTSLFSLLLRIDEDLAELARAPGCPWCGWTYANDGRLVGVPHERQSYGEQLDKPSWGERGGEYLVNSCFVLYRSRLEDEEHVFIGRRRDLLRRAPAGFEIARRRIVLTTNVLQSPNLSVFF